MVSALVQCVLMSSLHTYDILSAANINMAGGQAKVPDSAISNHSKNYASRCEAVGGIDVDGSKGMAYYLITGNETNQGEEINTWSLDKKADCLVLMFVLGYLQHNRCAKIEYMLDMPVEYLMRWKDSFAKMQSEGTIPSDIDYDDVSMLHRDTQQEIESIGLVMQPYKDTPTAEDLNRQMGL